MTGEEAEALFLAGLPGPAAELGLGTVVAPPSSRSSPRCRPSCGRGRRGSSSASTSMPATGSRRASRSPTSARCPTRSGTRRGSPSSTTAARARPPRPRAAGPRAQGRHLVRRRRGRRPDPDVSRLARRRGRADRGTFERPAGFDLAGYWAESAAAYERDVAAHRGRRPRPPGSPRPAAGRRRPRVVDAADHLAEPDPEGWLRLRLRLDWPDEAPPRCSVRGAGSRSWARPRSGPRRLHGPRHRRALRRRPL